ncbi:MAG: FliM/FliN family flagellar motor switch protein [Verrucomicrobiota bacterium]
MDTTGHSSAQGAEAESKPAGGGAQPRDFRTPATLPANALRKLRNGHTEYLHALAARLSIYLRMEFGLHLSRLETVPYRKFTEGLANPTHLTAFNVEPLRGVGVLEIHPRLGLTIVDRLMGGPGHSVELDRPLTEIEIVLLDQAVQVILGEWCHHWSRQMELRPTVLGHESSGQFLHTTHPDTPMLVLAIEARMADCREHLQLALAHSALEPLIAKLTEELKPATESPATAAGPRWNPGLADMDIPVTAEGPPLTLAAAELAALKPGDFLELPREFAAQIQLRLATAHKFAGRLGTQGGCWAVEIQRSIPS